MRGTTTRACGVSRQASHRARVQSPPCQAAHADSASRGAPLAAAFVVILGVLALVLVAADDGRAGAQRDAQTRRRQPRPWAGRLPRERLCRVPRAPGCGLVSVGRATVDARPSARERPECRKGARTVRRGVDPRPERFHIARLRERSHAAVRRPFETATRRSRLLPDRDVVLRALPRARSSCRRDRLRPARRTARVGRRLRGGRRRSAFLQGCSTVRGSSPSPGASRATGMQAAGRRAVPRRS